MNKGEILRIEIKKIFEHTGIILWKERRNALSREENNLNGKEKRHDQSHII